MRLSSGRDTPGELASDTASILYLFDTMTEEKSTLRYTQPNHEICNLHCIMLFRDFKSMLPAIRRFSKRFQKLHGE